MRSQVRFFMDAADEQRFVDAIVAESDTFLINGPHWNSSRVPLVDPRRLAGAESYLMIWNKKEVPRLRAKNMGDYWEAYNDSTTIQYLRSVLWDQAILTEGRIAIATDDPQIEGRYKRLRKVIKQICKNGVVCWYSPNSPKTEKNPSKPDRSVWIGPGALRWLQSSERHKFKLEPRDIVEAVVCNG